MIFATVEMMKPYLLFFVLTSFLFSCTKSLDITPEIIKTTTSGSRSLVRNLDSAVLTVTITSVVVCYSYEIGSAPRPCDEFIDIRCELSRPIQASVLVKLTGSKKQGVSGNAVVLSETGFCLAPNTKQITAREKLNGNSKEYAMGMYTISGVSVYKMVN
jgi:hypothetical protein